MRLVSMVSAEVQMSCRGKLLLRLHDKLVEGKQRAVSVAYRLLMNGESSAILALQKSRSQDRDAST